MRKSIFLKICYFLKNGPTKQIFEELKNYLTTKFLLQIWHTMPFATLWSATVGTTILYKTALVPKIGTNIFFLLVSLLLSLWQGDRNGAMLESRNAISDDWKTFVHRRSNWSMHAIKTPCQRAVFKKAKKAVKAGSLPVFHDITESICVDLGKWSQRHY